jgi:hypothetical protein
MRGATVFVVVELRPIESDVGARDLKFANPRASRFSHRSSYVPRPLMKIAV